MKRLIMLLLIAAAGCGSDPDRREPDAGQLEVGFDVADDDGRRINARPPHTTDALEHADVCIRVSGE